MCLCVCVCLAGSGDQVSGGRLKLWSPWLGWPGVDVNAEASVVGGSDSLGLTECVFVSDRRIFCPSDEVQLHFQS